MIVSEVSRILCWIYSLELIFNWLVLPSYSIWYTDCKYLGRKLVRIVEIQLTCERVWSCLTKLNAKGEGWVTFDELFLHLEANAGNCLREAINLSRMIPTNLLCISCLWISKSCKQRLCWKNFLRSQKIFRLGIIRILWSLFISCLHGVDSEIFVFQLTMIPWPIYLLKLWMWVLDYKFSFSDNPVRAEMQKKEWCLFD